MPIKRSTRPKKVMDGIYRDAEDRFRVEVWKKNEKTGKRQPSRRVVSTLEEAVAMKGQLERGDAAISPKRARQRLSDYVVRWLGERSSRYAGSTGEKLVMSLARLSGAFGDLYLDAIEPGDIRAWMNRSTATYAASTINGSIRDLRYVFDDAKMDRLVISNPAREVKLLPEKRTSGPRGTSLSPEDFGRFLNAVEALKGKKGGISEDVARLLLLVAWTGVRTGEAFALKWPDLVDGELRVERSVWKRTEKATKTDDPRRIAVPEPLARVLEEQRRWLIETQHPGLESDLMFPASAHGARASATRRKVDELSWYRASSTLRRPLAKVVSAAKIPKVSPHSFRRTMENLLRQAGVDGMVRRANAGWRTEKAQSIYATVSKEERADGQAKVVSLVSKGRG